ncbi:hypothetical protein [Rathayibacter tritici]|uniref:hypothetical protein n=1 Tax=Rathayibacter tritici TaxID=33888 RepID=UPI0011B03D8C|nr:hypothetical protein [Rathayibacter tritici]
MTHGGKAVLLLIGGLLLPRSSRAQAVASSVLCRLEGSGGTVKTRVIFYLLGGVFVLGAGINSVASTGFSLPNLLTMLCGALILAIAGWQALRSWRADSDREPPR